MIDDVLDVRWGPFTTIDDVYNGQVALVVVPGMVAIIRRERFSCLSGLPTTNGCLVHDQMAHQTAWIGPHAYANGIQDLNAMVFRLVTSGGQRGYA